MSDKLKQFTNQKKMLTIKPSVFFVVFLLILGTTFVLSESVELDSKFFFFLKLICLFELGINSSITVPVEVQKIFEQCLEECGDNIACLNQCAAEKIGG